MEVTKMKPGDRHYKAYVGPPTQYDVMGATQFRLLCTLGLRADHTVLDIGCGSLRAGRLFIGYLDPERYFGIDPNQWLIEEAIENQVGKDLISLKKPRFDYNSEFNSDIFSQQFDYIVAQSIFSHTGSDIISTALNNFHGSLKADGLVAATFVEGISDFEGEGWIYPECVNYRRGKIDSMAKEAGFSVLRLPWYHPSQTWYLLAKDKDRLPNRVMLRQLGGAILFDPEFENSWKQSKRVQSNIMNFVRQALPEPIKKSLKKMLKEGD